MDAFKKSRKHPSNDKTVIYLYKITAQNTYTKVTAFLVFMHFLLMNIKMPRRAQTRPRLPTKQVTMSDGSTGTDTSSLQRSP